MVTSRSSLSGWERDPERERSYPRSHGKMRLGLREPVSLHFSSPRNHTKVSGPSLRLLLLLLDHELFTKT